MWVTRKLWNEAVAKWDAIAKKGDETAASVKVLNHEYGKIQTSVKVNMWLTGIILIGILGVAWAVIQKLFLGA